MADLHWLDGIHVADATGFGESSSGIWIPKDYAGAYGTMGFKYDFNDSANFGDDVSGNAQDGTATNMGVDHQVSDRPEDNYCTLDTNATRSNITSLLEGGLSPRDAGAAWHSSLGTFLLKTGKWYFEVDVGADADDIKAGIIAAGEYVGDIITADTDPGPIGYVLHCDASGAVYNAESSGGATGDDNLDAPAASDIMTVAIDCDAGKIWFGMKNAGSGHVWGDFGATGVGNPANGTNPSFSSLDFDLYDFVPVIGVNAHSTSMANFGQRTFSGTQPTGFKALCTSNLTSPTADDPQDDYINVITYEGTGAENAQTGVGFQPDFVWIKNRDTTDPHLVFDDIRGATVHLEPDKTAAEATTAQTLKSFDADGFTLGTDNEVNTNNEDFVAWCLKEQSSFFDMVSYTGSGAAHTESHDLGVVPEMMIVKNRDQADSWTVYHKAALNKTDPETDRGLLDTTGAWSDAATIWNDTAPTSAVFTVGTAHNVNANNEKYIAYLFASIAGLSKVFAYEGNGNAAGPYVYCGFRPNWILIKDVDSVANWFMFNTAVNTYNPVSNSLKASVTDAEASGTNAMDIHANGFKITHNNGTWSINGNNKTIVGIAFAEQPFNYANAR